MMVLAASFAPDGKHVALLARDSLDRPQVWTQEVRGVANGFAAPMRLTAHTHVASTRVRWTRDGSALLYSADGKLRRMDARGGSPATIEFSAHLSVTRPARHLPPARLIDTSGHVPARAFLGLALSPDGTRIGAIALGKLWIIPVGGRPRAVTDVPFTARGLSWSPDGKEVAWSAGPFGEEDLFAADVNTGAKRQITALAGREAAADVLTGRPLHRLHAPEGRAAGRAAHHRRACHERRDRYASRAEGRCRQRWIGPGASTRIPNGAPPPMRCSSPSARKVRRRRAHGWSDCRDRPTRSRPSSTTRSFSGGTRPRADVRATRSALARRHSTGAPCASRLAHSATMPRCMRRRRTTAAFSTSPATGCV